MFWNSYKLLVPPLSRVLASELWVVYRSDGAMGSLVLDDENSFPRFHLLNQRHQLDCVLYEVCARMWCCCYCLRGREQVVALTALRWAVYRAKWGDIE